jgi:hypothetical protein
VTTLFVFCAAAGGGLLLLQLLASMLGADASHGGGELGHPEHAGAEGLHLFSVRSLAAGIAAFGLAGLAVRAAGLPLWAAVVAALAGAGAAMVAVASLMRGLLRLESDGTVRIEGAVGQPAVVYLGVPGGRAGTGKVHLTLQNRLVELQAVTTQAAQLPTGADVIIVDVLGPDTVEVVPTPSLED